MKLYNFRDHLNESLDTPAQFNLTDDTVLPHKVFSVFNIDDTQYGISLEETNFEKVYNLKLYRISNGKPRLWAFKSPTHIRTCLATLLKFAEASLPFLKARMDGIVVQIPGASSASRFNTFVDRMIKKSHVTTFRSVPVNKTDEEKQPYEHLFIARKAVPVSSLFKSKTFAKYNLKDVGDLTDVVLNNIKPKAAQKQTVKTVPSKKLTFKNLETTELSIDNEVLDQITKLKAVSNGSADIKKEDAVVLSQSDISMIFKNTFDTADFKDFIMSDPNFQKLQEMFKGIDSHDEKEANLFLKKVAESSFEHMKQKFPLAYRVMLWSNLANKTYDEYKGKVVSFEKLFDEQFSKKYLDFSEFLIKVYDIKKSHYFSTGNQILDLFRKDHEKIRMNRYQNFENSGINNAQIDYFYLNYYKRQFQLKNHNISTTNIDPNSLQVNVPGSGNFSYDTSTFETTWVQDTGEENESVSQKESYVLNTLDYFTKMSNLPVGVRKAAKKYAGDGYQAMNGVLRRAFTLYTRLDKGEVIHQNVIDYGFSDLLESGDVKSLYKGMQLLDPLPEALWVYRTTDIPESIVKSLEDGEDYVDPAFQSTSLRSDNSYGFENLKLRIYLPKGSRVYPLLSQSKYSSEKEVILPPFSIQKVIRLDKIETEHSNKPAYLATTIFSGSVYESFIKYAKEKMSLKEEVEKQLLKKESKYDPNEKFGGVNDPEIYEKIIEYIKSGKFKVEKS